MKQEKNIHKLKSKFLSNESIISTEGKLKRYNGISQEVFDSIFDAIINPSLPQFILSKLSFKDQFLIKLVKQRRNISFENLADEFNCARSSILLGYLEDGSLCYTQSCLF